MEKSQTVEQEIAQLEQQLQEKKASLGQRSDQEELPTDKEILREVVGEKLQEHAPEYTPKSSSTQTQAQSQSQTVAAGDLTDEIREKIQELVNRVFHVSLVQGIKDAASSGNPALIDAFHDILVDQLYDVLVERNKVEVVK